MDAEGYRFGLGLHGGWYLTTPHTPRKTKGLIAAPFVFPRGTTGKSVYLYVENRLERKLEAF
jgi:hypothetical protein